MQNNSHIKSGVGIRSTSDYSGFGVLLDGRTANSGDYRYGFQGQEMDDEIKGEGNSYTTDFRQYDPRLGRWLSIDRLAFKYSDRSSYETFANNPLIFVDVNGDSIKLFRRDENAWIIKGWLQTLTNDKLTVDANGNIIIEKMNSENLDQTLTSGTSLIRELVSNEGIVTIRLNDQFISQALTLQTEDSRNPSKGAKWVDVHFDRKHTYDFNVENPANGNTELEVLTKNEIVLGHELIHAYRMLKGLNKSNVEASIEYKNRKGENRIETYNLEEYETIGLKGNFKYTENKLRKEHKLKKRVSYGDSE
jgi:RHS repeat-associated protein